MSDRASREGSCERSTSDEHCHWLWGDLVGRSSCWLMQVSAALRIHPDLIVFCCDLCPFNAPLHLHSAHYSPCFCLSVKGLNSKSSVKVHAAHGTGDSTHRRDTRNL